jgi:c-di-GMP-binding flagellar brake protein YcgR
MKKKRSARRIERRRSTRADARLSMRVESAPSEGERTQIVTETQNISANGVYCSSLHYLAPASRVALTIVLPKLPGMTGAKELIKCEGIVVRCEPPAKRGDRHYELACMFSGLDDKRRMLIEEFVTWRNLQALRAAANRGNGVRPAARPKVRGAKRKVAKAARGSTTRRTIH